MLSEFSLSSSAKAGQEASFVEMISNFKEKLVQHKRNVAAFTALLIAGCVLLGGTIFFFKPQLVTYIQVIGFLALGYIHTLVLGGNLSMLTATEKLLYSFFAALLVMISLWVFHLYSESYSLLSALACTCAFFLPYSLSELWRLYSSMQGESVRTWAYTEDLSLQRTTTFLNSMPVRFRVRMGQSGKNELPVSFRAPVRMKLGLIFYHLAQEQNNNGQTPIPFTDESKVPYQWLFFTAGINGKRYLDPETGLLENGVRENAIVFVQQVID